MYKRISHALWEVFFCFESIEKWDDLGHWQLTFHKGFVVHYEFCCALCFRLHVHQLFYQCVHCRQRAVFIYLCMCLCLSVKLYRLCNSFLLFICCRQNMTCCFWVIIAFHHIVILWKLCKVINVPFDVWHSVRETRRWETWIVTYDVN